MVSNIMSLKNDQLKEADSMLIFAVIFRWRSNSLISLWLPGRPYRVLEWSETFAGRLRMILYVCGENEVWHTYLATPTLSLVHESNGKLRGHWFEKTSDKITKPSSWGLYRVPLIELASLNSSHRITRPSSRLHAGGSIYTAQ
jgi:hypothetical protein